ncbi:MAG: PEP-CTERM sorting domain-containing protein [Limisphaera sp.]
MQKRMLLLGWGSAACAGLLGVNSAGATFDEVQFWVGTGTNRAALVIDWADGLGPESLLWGYQWNGQASGLDMLVAVVRADARLFAHLGQYAWGTAVFGLGYDRNDNGIFSVTPAPGFDADGVAWSLSPNDARTADDPADHWREGWNNGFWAYYTKSTADDPWASSMVGAADRVLSDGVWDGWRFAPGFAGQPPGTPAPAPVPEPTGWVLFLLGGGLLAWARRQPA